MKILPAIILVFILSIFQAQVKPGYYVSELSSLNLREKTFYLEYKKNSLWPERIKGIWLQSGDTLQFVDSLRHNNCSTTRNTKYLVTQEKLKFISQVVHDQKTYYQCVRGREVMANLRIYNDNWGDLRSISQAGFFIEIEKDLNQTYSRIFPFYYSDHDSLDHYSNLFEQKMRGFLYEDPGTFTYDFQSLQAGSGLMIANSPDNKFRIYSWNTWQGGSMHRFANIYQFKSAGQVYTKEPPAVEGDMGTMVNKIFSLVINQKTHYLIVSSGNFSSKDVYEMISVSTIEKSSINDSVPLFKTPEGIVNNISCEYDFHSLPEQLERPLIKYDSTKKLIYIPVILENGQVTDRHILYQFNGKYFEHLLTEKIRGKTK